MIEKRKSDHIEICAKADVNFKYNYWEDVQLIHNALPTIDFDEINTESVLFGKKLSAPIVIAAITGGSEKSKEINRNLAIAAEKFQIGLGVGSQRAALENQSIEDTYSIIKDYDIPLVIGNLGAPQLVDQKDAAIKGEDIEACMDMINADLMAIHFNYLQEVTQIEGDLNARGVEENLRSLARKYPLIGKETGAGISNEVALKFKKIGMTGIDVGGAGGTSFAAVEHYRSQKKNDLKAELGEVLWDWGIPTPVCISNAQVGLPVIATGGIRNGLDVAKSLVLGADSAGIAGILLKDAIKSSDAVIQKIEAIISQLKAVMFLSDSVNIHELQGQNCIVTGQTKDWFEQI